MKNGNKIREIRKAAGLSQIQFAEILGITQNHLSNIEKGERSITLEIANKITDIFDITLDWLIKDKGLPPTKIHIIQRTEALTNNKGFGV